LDSLREGIQILGPDFRYLYVNEAVAKHGRKPRAELLGRTMLECYPGIERTAVFATLERCMRERSSAALETEFEYADGQRAWFELRIHPSAEGLIVLSLDISERKQLEASLRQAHKLRALGQMASGVAHDLKNVLNPLGLLLSVLEHKLGPASTVADTLELMRTSLKHGTRTIQVLLDFARQTPEPDVQEPIQIDTVIAEASRLCRPRALEHEPRITIDERLGAPPLVRLNASELLASLVNLIVNAIDAMPEGGCVTLRSGSGDEGVWLEVSDNGTGMSEEVQRRAFEPFFTTKGDAGIGLGLAMVYAFVSRHRGSVRLQSTPGAGTTVTLVFPPA
jgi:PAS domain S-box-containing protein